MDGVSLGLAVTIPLLLLGVVTAIVLFGMRASSSTVSMLRKAAAELSLTDVQLIPDVQSALIGRVDGFRVTVTESVHHPEEQAQSQRATEVLVEGGIAGGLELVPEPRGLTRALHRQHPDVLTGDRALDESVRITGPPDLVLAVLDHETRAEVTRALSEGVKLREGQLYLVVPGRLGTVASVVDRVRRLLSLARRLVPPPDLVPPLVRTALGDPVSGARTRALELLAERHADRPDVREALNRALRDQNPAVRLVAAAALRDEGSPILLELAQRAETPLEVATRAATALGVDLPLETAAGLLDRALAANEVELATAMVTAHGAIGDSRAGGRLTAVLGHSSVELCIAAADALELVGTVDAVPALRAAAERHGGNRRLRQAVAVAVASIQGRTTGAMPGQLSLSGGAAGKVALVDDLVGGLGLVPEKPGS